VIVLITGETGHSDAKVRAALDALHAETPIALLMHAERAGALDIAALGQSAASHAELWGVSRDVPAAAASWPCQGADDAARRNASMVRQVCGLMRRTGLPALCLAFPGGAGAADCARRATAAGIEVREIDQ
jgi:hypothetical protein